MPEVILWSRLRGRQVGGLRFRRQHPLGPFIADFYRHEAALVVEIDGKWTHGRGTPRDDAGRDAWMRERGLHVLRVAAANVNESAAGVVQLIERAAMARLAAFGHKGTPSALEESGTSPGGTGGGG